MDWSLQLKRQTVLEKPMRPNKVRNPSSWTLNWRRISLGKNITWCDSARPGCCCSVRALFSLHHIIIYKTFLFSETNVALLEHITVSETSHFEISNTLFMWWFLCTSYISESSCFRTFHTLLVFWISLPLVGIPACVSWKSQLISQIKSWIAKCHGNVLHNVFASCHRYGISDVMSISERWQQAQSEGENLTVEDNLQPGDRQYCILFQSLKAKDKISQNTPKVSCNKELLTLLPWKVDKQKALNDSQGWW
jgi:hypothetical protein